MRPTGPYCPTCHRRLHALQAPPVQPCLACGKPVQGLGLGRPRQLHPECRNVRRKSMEGRAKRRARRGEVRP